MRLILTAHARDQMLDRGVTRKMVERTLRRGSKIRQTDGLLATYEYVRVAYHVVGDAYIVKTVMIKK
jgi:hypothetical protein